MSATASVLILGASTSVRLATGLVILKFFAWYFGPANFGLLTQIMGVAAIFNTFAGGGITNGLIRNIAAARSEIEIRGWLSAGMTINALSSLVLTGIALVLWQFNEGAVFRNPSYAPVFLGIALVQPFVGIGNLILAYFSGIRQIHKYSVINVVANITSLLVLIGLAQVLGLKGAIAGLILSPALIGGIALWSLSRDTRDHGVLRFGWDGRQIADLMWYAAAMACAVTAAPISQLIIRLRMSESAGWEFVGYWQAVAKLSDSYMLFVGVVLVNHLLPELSRRRDNAHALRSVCRLGAPIVCSFALGATAVYLDREQIIRLVFSPEFSWASTFVLPQLLGDGVRVIALLLHYFFMSRGLIFVVCVNETIPPIATLLFYVVFFPYFGPIAAVYGHVVSGILLLFTTVATLLFFQSARL